MKGLLVLFLSASFLAGCRSGFVYRCKANPLQRGPKLPVKVAVLAFDYVTGHGGIVGIVS